MIHHTLLPDEEIKELRKEYRVRLFIISLFFISLAIVVGILSLFPAYMSVYSPESWALTRSDEVQVNKQVVSTEDMQKELVLAQQAIAKLTAGEDGTSYSDIIQDILAHRSAGIFITSFEMSRVVGTSTTPDITVSGKASSREALIDFKKRLEGDVKFKKVELPVSDLAKSKDVKFSLKIK